MPRTKWQTLTGVFPANAKEIAQTRVSFAGNVFSKFAYVEFSQVLFFGCDPGNLVPRGQLAKRQIKARVERRVKRDLQEDTAEDETLPRPLPRAVTPSVRFVYRPGGGSISEETIFWATN